MIKNYILLLSLLILISCGDSETEKYDFTKRIGGKQPSGKTNIQSAKWINGRLEVSGKCNSNDVLLFVNPQKPKEIMGSTECKKEKYTYKQSIARPPCSITVEAATGEINTKVVGAEKFCKKKLLIK